MHFTYRIEENMKENLSKKFSFYFDKLKKFCDKHSIFVESQEENVRFSKENKELFISYMYLWRQSGISHVHKDVDVKKNLVEIVEITDEMFYKNYVEPIIELNFVK